MKLDPKEVVKYTKAEAIDGHPVLVIQLRNQQEVIVCNQDNGGENVCRKYNVGIQGA